MTALGAPAPAGRAPGRLGNVDALRAVAALAVLAIHAYALGGRVVPVRAEHAYDVPLAALASGVWLFFAISGYVIGRPFVSRLLRGAPLPALRPYALRRAARIYPLFWVALGGLIAIGGLQGTRPWQLAFHVALLNNLVPGRQEALFPAAWTLTLEVLFYIALPLLALAAARARRPLTPERLAGWILISWGLSIAFTVVADAQGDGTTGVWLRFTLPSMWQMFCPGLLLAVVPHLRSPRWRRALVQWPERRAAAVLALACLLAAAVLSETAPLRYGVVPYQLLVDASRPLYAVGYGMVLAWAIRGRAWGSDQGPVLALGLASYGIYLWHPVLSELLLREGWVPLPRNTLGAFVVHLLFLALLTVPLAVLSWRVLERPLVDLARRTGRRRPGHAPTLPEMATPDMRHFWNERAREDAFYFVDNRQRYRAPDPARFWEGGALLAYVFDTLGVRPRPTEVALDIGCGVGRLTRALAPQVREVIALDVSDEMLARGRSLNPDLANVRWLLGDGITLDGVPSDGVDCAISLVVFQHLPDPQIALGYVAELARVLRPGGWAVVQVSDDPDVHRPRDSLWLRARALIGRAPRGQRHPAWLGTPVDLEQMRTAAAGHGLEVETVWGAGTQYCLLLLRRRP